MSLLRTIIYAILAYGTLGGLFGVIAAGYLRYVRATPAPRSEVARVFLLGGALLAFSTPLFAGKLIPIMILWTLGYTVLFVLLLITFWRLQYGNIRRDLRIFLASPRFTRTADEETPLPDDERVK